MKIFIRDLAAADLPAVAAMEADEPGGWSLEQWTAELARAGGWQLVALDSATGRVIGYMAGMAVGNEAEIFRLLVAPDCRRRGVATGLLRQLWKRLPGLGVTSCFLEVRAANRAALELYRQMGFEHCGLRPGYYHDPEDDAVVLARPVAKGPNMLNQGGSA
ncbi:ribosomal protein S18-alanine N-acetyltransferase [Desulfurivibrio alkaliphilus]|uniref:Ribosomal-protein-alanine acetyltransferase n=1 Tax=Desulfurivibrio alkaliphilus (strain DSM 19089 / UNIQEM U267 / AHT2) TaxID=589865 RepID=D6Z592_DESAT|nr:ribosomal protein S18-alanine N-acetyltransferase [Desulfurivibrio alkaliphilus]ADH84749.1 ribosomal-protein-alanine acetyltransferase [Desulfurivibrio alkaliphilus AHT 2]